jgi:Aminopeptidase P, N-terminal domain
MRRIRLIVWFLLATTFVGATDNGIFSARRKRAASAFHDGILIVHAVSRLDGASDGYRQDPYFYYFTGLENTIGALLAIDGKSGESWLFLPDHPPYQKKGIAARGATGGGCCQASGHRSCSGLV